MIKQTPSFGRIFAMVAFALSCFGILVFLWLSFGGSVPLQPQGYRVTVPFPEATQLAQEAEVRISGVRGVNDALGEPAAGEDAVLSVVVLLRVLPEHRIVGVQITDGCRALVLDDDARARAIQRNLRVGLEHHQRNDDQKARQRSRG